MAKKVKKERKASNNRFGIDYAFPGLCSLCHTEIALFDEEGIRTHPVLKRFLPNKREIQIELNDGSHMTVMLCQDCTDIDWDDLQELMESEINGWQSEMNFIRDWTKDKKISYMLSYSEKYATGIVGKEMPEGSIKKPRKEKLKLVGKED